MQLSWSHIQKKECEECDKTQMKNLKCALNLRRSNHNTLIRLMTAEYRFQTIKTVRTLNLIRKLRKQPDEKLPPEIKTLGSNEHKI